MKSRNGVLLLALLSVLMMFALAACNTPADPYEEPYEEPCVEHTYGEWTTVKAGKCLERGIEKHICTVCGEEEQREVPSPGHEEIHHAGEPALCYRNGFEDYVTCKNCAYTTYRAIEKLEHNYENEVCTLCQMTKGLKFADNGDGTCYVSLYQFSTEHVVIPSVAPDGKTVTGIGKNAFAASRLTSIVIPSTVTFIDTEAFTRSNLTSIVIPDSVKRIETKAFESCVNLTSVTMPASLEKLGARAFLGCTALESITVPNGLTTLEHQLFNSCQALSSVMLPDTLTDIEYYAFSGCKALDEVNLPSGLINIGANAFAGTALKSVTIPASVVSVDQAAFARCTSLVSVHFEEGSPIDMLRENVFVDCAALEEINFPASLCIIEASSFTGCDALIEKVDCIHYVNNWAIGHDEDFAPTDLILPEGTVGIARGAFANILTLKTVSLPATVVHIGGGAFYGCKWLESVTVEVTEGWYEQKTDGAPFDASLPGNLAYLLMYRWLGVSRK